MLVERNDKLPIVILKLNGRIDSTNAPEFEKEIDAIGPDVERLVIDCENLEYTSSAGLRVILKAQKLMSRRGGLTLQKVSNEVMEILDITGFSEILNIE